MGHRMLFKWNKLIEFNNNYIRYKSINIDFIMFTKVPQYVW